MNTVTARTHSGLMPYAGTWDTEQVIHLLRRTTFGAKKADIDALKALTMPQAIDTLLTPLAAPAPPLNDYDVNGTIDPTVPYGQTWVNAPVNSSIEFLRRKSWFSWWGGLMLNQGANLTEKMTLFWHNHFATESAIVSRGISVYRHNALLRASCFGNFKQLVKEVTLDSAMLIYLNGYKNSNTAPDENYARELQELFTVGKINGIAPYLEDDVKAAAKVLTGYRIDATTGYYYFNSLKHDVSNKTFSAFYGNTVIIGQSGAAGETELDVLLDMIFVKDEVALNICRKLYRFFVYYEIDATTETNVIEPLATIFRNNNYDILPVLDALFKSEHFFDMANRSCVIRPPLDFIVGMCREMGMNFPDNTNVNLQYKMWYYLVNQAKGMQQEAGSPPSVAGWPAYYQAPQFHEMWINAVTLPLRTNLATRFLGTGYTTGGFTLKFDLVTFVQNAISNPFNPNTVVSECCILLLGIDISQTTKDTIKTSALLSGQAMDSYWTDAWNDYTSAPTNTTYYNAVKSRLTAMFSTLMGIAEYHLS
ncbi:MAG: DUF1800 family protein [Bacteroidia bacterium]